MVSAPAVAAVIAAWIVVYAEPGAPLSQSATVAMPSESTKRVVAAAGLATNRIAPSTATAGSARRALNACSTPRRATAPALRALADPSSITPRPWVGRGAPGPASAGAGDHDDDAGLNVGRQGAGACHRAGERLPASADTTTTARIAVARPRAATLLTSSTSTAPSTAPPSIVLTARRRRITAKRSP